MKNNIFPIPANTLKGANAYFTNFDHRIISEISNDEIALKNIERNLKVLLLTKNNVVCAASHLVTPFSYNLFKQNPVLLNEDLVIPALRSDIEDVEELFLKEDIIKYYDKNAIEFYNENLNLVVEWDLINNSDWFRKVFLSGFQDENSVLRRSLTNISNDEFEKIYSKINSVQILDRKSIEKAFINFDDETKKTVKNYRELIYYISGARVVNCESNLPQENYIDYSLTDIDNRKIILSDIQIFWKIFLELVFEKINNISIPFELLDLLSFNDINEIRQPILESNFISNYDKIVKSGFSSLNKIDDDQLLYNVNEISKLAEIIQKQFTSAIEKELISFLKKRRKKSIFKLVGNSINIGLGLLPQTIIQNIGIGTFNERNAIRTNILEIYRTSKSIQNKNLYKLQKQKTLSKLISKFEISDRTILLDIVKLIMNTIQNKTKI